MIPRNKKSALTDVDIMMYLALGLKHLRLMVLLIAFSLSLGLFYYCYARPIYYSKGLVRYRVLVEPLDTEKVFRDANDRAVLRELRSPHILVRTAKKLGVSASADTLVKKYIKKIKVGIDSQRNIVVEVWPYSAEWARKWPETMVQEYLLNREERRLEHIRVTFQRFTEDMEDLRQKMDQVFNQQFDYRDSNELTKIIIDLNRYKEVPRAIQTVKHHLALMDQTREALHSPGRDTVSKLSLLGALEKQLRATEVGALPMIQEINVGTVLGKDEAASGLVVVPSMISSPLQLPWEELDKEARRLQQSMEETGRTFLPGHAKMVALKKQLDAVNKQLDLELAVENNRLDLRYASALERLAQLERELPAYEEVTRRHERYLREYKHFDAGQMTWNKMYDEMSKRLQALDFAADKERADLQFLELLEVKDTPVAPNALKLVIRFLLLGLALAVAVPFFIEYLDSRVSDVDQVEETLHIRGLGVVPKISESPMEHLALPEVKPDHHVSENFRLIRTNLVMNSSTPALPQVILVTSAMPQEGKTVVAAHLAMSFARKGERTLLMDADMRRGRLHRLFGCANRPGLGEVLNQQHPLEAAFRPIMSNGNGHHNGDEVGAESTNGNGCLTLLTCGKHMHSASELLDSHVFPKLMDKLRQTFQRIIIDTPPVLGLSETLIVQRSVDGVVLVIWSEYTAMRNVKAAMQLLQTNGAQFAGFVLNRLDFSVLTNRYRYFYYSPYYYRNYKAIAASTDAVEK